MVLFHERVDEIPTDVAPEPDQDSPLLAPVTPGTSWDSVHALSQTPLRDPRDPIIAIRRTATIRAGTRMVKLLSERQLSAYLHGRRPSGFCYRESDLVRLRAAGDLAVLLGDAMPTDVRRNDVVFGLRWRAVDAVDYDIPFATDPRYAGLTSISPHDRLGPAVDGLKLGACDGSVRVAPPSRR